VGQSGRGSPGMRPQSKELNHLLYKEIFLRNDVLDEQVAYYRARAQEYDESILGPDVPAAEEGRPEELAGALGDAANLVRRLGPFEQVLELA
jgi:hypothetical protein